MSKLVLMRTSAGDATGLLHFQNARASVIAVGDNLTVEDGALNASGGGSDDEMAGIPVVLGYIAPVANQDMFVIFDIGAGPFVTNYNIASAMDGIIRAWLEALPGFAEGATLSVVNSNIEWVP